MQEFELLLFEIGNELFDVTHVPFVDPTNFLLSQQTHSRPLSHFVVNSRASEFESSRMARTALISLQFEYVSADRCGYSDEDCAA